MRLAYERYSGEKGFTPAQFIKVAEDIAGTDLKGWFHRALTTADELDYSDALNWLGLELQPTPGSGSTANWKLRVREHVSSEQKTRLKNWLTGKNSGK